MEQIIISEILKFMSFGQDIIVQSEDFNLFSSKNFKIVSKRKPSSKQLKILFLLSMYVGMLNQMQYYSHPMKQLLV